MHEPGPPCRGGFRPWLAVLSRRGVASGRRPVHARPDAGSDAGRDAPGIAGQEASLVPATIGTPPGRAGLVVVGVGVEQGLLAGGCLAAFTCPLFPVVLPRVGQDQAQVDQPHLAARVAGQRQPGRPGRAGHAGVERRRRDPQPGRLAGGRQGAALEFARRAEASDVGNSVVEQLELTVDDLATAYPRTPSADLLGRVRTHLGYIGHLLDARATLAQHRRLLVTGGWLSLLAFARPVPGVEEGLQDAVGVGWLELDPVALDIGADQRGQPAQERPVRDFQPETDPLGAG